MEILPFLYLGSAYHASRKDMLDALGITALINVSANCPNHFEGHYQYKSIPVEDNHKADISSWFNEAIDFIGKRALSTVLLSPVVYPGSDFFSFFLGGGGIVFLSAASFEIEPLLHGDKCPGTVSINFIQLRGIILALQNCLRS